MTPKEQQLAENIIDLALGARNPGDLESFVGTYIRFTDHLRYSAQLEQNFCGLADGAEPPVAQGLPTVFEDLVRAGNESAAATEAVTETAAAPKARKPRATKPEAAPEPPAQEVETVEEKPAEPEGKTLAEKITEAQNAYMALFKDLSEDEAAQKELRVKTTALSQHHGGERISKVPEANFDAFLSDLHELIANSQPV